MLAYVMALALFLTISPGATAGSLSWGQATPSGPDGMAANTVTAAGSATLGPVLEAAAEAFAEEHPDVTVDVERSSSGAGIEQFCAGEIDLATSGRQIKDDESAICEEAGVTFEEFEVAFDGVAVVVNPANTEVTCITVDQLKRAWEPQSTVKTWADLDSAWPNENIALYGMGEESGTFQFFTQVTVGEEGAARDDYNVTEGHPETADAVAEDEQGLGFLPFPRYLENQDRLKLLEVDGGEGCIAPSPETIQDGTYSPLARSLYVYVSHASLGRTEVQDYLTFWFGDAATYAEAGGLVPTTDDVYEANVGALRTALEDGTPSSTPTAP
jgi:phosphate transport system substrate-binding protein